MPELIEINEENFPGKMEEFDEFVSTLPFGVSQGEPTQPQKKRIGRFSISLADYRRHSEQIAKIWSAVDHVLEAKFFELRNPPCWEYAVVCKDFDPIELGEVPPIYVPVVKERKDGTHEVAFEKQESPS